MRNPLELQIADGHQHGEAIRRLIHADEWQGLEDLDWTHLAGQWVIVVKEDEIVACVQVMPGKPIGRVEHLGMADSLTQRERAEIVHMLISHCSMVLQLAGCGAMMAMVQDDLVGFQRIMERRGGVTMELAKMMIKRLA